MNQNKRITCGTGRCLQSGSRLQLPEVLHVAAQEENCCCNVTEMQPHRGHLGRWRSVSLITWLKLSSALCRLACIPVGGSLVILMEFSKIPWGMMWPSGVAEGSALTNTRKFSWLPSACCSRSFSSVPSQRATRWMFCKTTRHKNDNLPELPKNRKPWNTQWTRVLQWDQCSWN